MRLLWWRKVRKANIPQTDRDIFERFGEPVIGFVLAGRSMELHAIYREPTKQDYARDWLTERSDLRELRENRVEAVEWAVLLFVILGVILDVMLVRLAH
jgi:hypothetical protein